MICRVSQAAVPQISSLQKNSLDPQNCGRPCACITQAMTILRRHHKLLSADLQISNTPPRIPFTDCSLCTVTNDESTHLHQTHIPACHND